MDLLNNLVVGFSTAASVINLFYCLVGVFLGTAIGVLPGLGPVATIAMLLPVTFGLPPVTALIMLAGIFYGAQYGGSTTAILVNLPGESSSVVTALDGYQMARQGRAGTALATAAIGSFFAGTVATFLIALFAPPLAEVALKFGPADYFSLMVLGLVASIVLAQRLAAARARHDHPRPAARPDRHRREFRPGALSPSTFRNSPTASASSSSPWACSASARSSRNLETRAHARRWRCQGVTGLMPSRGGPEAHRRADPARHGARARCWASCPAAAPCCRRSPPIRWRRRFRRTRPSSARARSKAWRRPKSANNAGAQTSFIPMLTLGIPSNPVMALMIGAMIIQGIQPGPQVMTEQPALFWGLIVSMWIGNLFLLVLNLPLIGLWVKMIIGALPPALSRRSWCSARIGVFSLSNTAFDVYLMALFGVLGYVFAQARLRAGADAAGLHSRADDGGVPAPGDADRQGDAMVLRHPADQRHAAGGLAVALVVVLLPALRKKREEAFQD